MKVVLSLFVSIIAISLIVILDTRMVLPAPLGRLLSPHHGIWQNAEDEAADFSAMLKFPQLKGKVDVYLDERLVPHVFAEQETDVYFVQGYLHAKFRLWQMELQTHAAAGRASEIIGSKALAHDREFRRLGMGYAAEIALKEMEKDTATKVALDAYTAGANAWISSLTESQLPLEYKLIGYAPEPWTNLKTALFLKYMSHELSGADDDFEMTNAKNYFSKEDFDLLYPQRQDSLDPIVPKGTTYPAPKVNAIMPATADSLYFNNKELLAVKTDKPNRSNGSNNWAVSGAKTKSGVPILCNDPHLGLNLPSLWFEMQLSTPGFNAYGATFPGAPSVIIGFNDYCAFGFTNGGRDVKDYYQIKFKDDSRKEYWFDSAWRQTEFRVERIKVKDSADVVDSVAYTVFGPVMFDKTYSGTVAPGSGYYALRWTSNDPSNELKIFIDLNHAKNYADYSSAVLNLHTPGQNCVFACKDGDIAIRTQGMWPAKWQGQGDFIMPGADSSFMWQGMIPMDETPFQYNPERGFVSSANQKPADSTYPYYLGRNYPPYRGQIINRKLAAMPAGSITVESMKALQTNNYDVFAEAVRPVLLKNIQQSALSENGKKYLVNIRDWNLNNDAGASGPIIFYSWWNNFQKLVYDDEFAKAPAVINRPYESTLLDAVLRDSAYKFIDNIATPNKETLETLVTQAFNAATVELSRVQAESHFIWGKYRPARISHLAKLAAFSREDLEIGGGVHCINAINDNHGPSWRMIVELTANTNAWGVYPGGQSGNPGSRFYDNFVYQWAAGEYYKLWMMTKAEVNSDNIKWRMSFIKA